jgi:hypothetical protein
MAEPDATFGTYSYPAREAVGVFASPEALEAAVDELEVAGFDRATVSVLASDATIKERVGRIYRSVAEAEDDRKAPQAAFVSSDSRTEGEAAIIGIPAYIGGAAGAIVASGGALAATIAAAIAGGVAGAGLGALLALVVARHHTEHVLEQLAQGGMVLWVSVRDKNAEARALQILANAGARDVHVHEIQREWTLKDLPLSEAQPDPFLERDS